MPAQSLAVDISLAALLGDKIYNFGELLLHPIVRRPCLPVPPHYPERCVVCELYSASMRLSTDVLGHSPRKLNGGFAFLVMTSCSDCSCISVLYALRMAGRAKSNMHCITCAVAA